MFCCKHFCCVVILIVSIFDNVITNGPCPIQVELLPNKMIKILNEDEMCRCLEYNKPEVEISAKVLACDLETSISDGKISFSAISVCGCIGYATEPTIIPHVTEKYNASTSISVSNEAFNKSTNDENNISATITYVTPAEETLSDREEEIIDYVESNSSEPSEKVKDELNTSDLFRVNFQTTLEVFDNEFDEMSVSDEMTPSSPSASSTEEYTGSFNLSGTVSNLETEVLDFSSEKPNTLTSFTIIGNSTDVTNNNRFETSHSDPVFEKQTFMTDINTYEISSAVAILNEIDLYDTDISKELYSTSLNGNSINTSVTLNGESALSNTKNAESTSITDNVKSSNSDGDHNNSKVTLQAKDTFNNTYDANHESSSEFLTVDITDKNENYDPFSLSKKTVIKKDSTDFVTSTVVDIINTATENSDVESFNSDSIVGKHLNNSEQNKRADELGGDVIYYEYDSNEFKVGQNLHEQNNDYENVIHEDSTNEIPPLIIAVMYNHTTTPVLKADMNTRDDESLLTKVLYEYDSKNGKIVPAVFENRHDRTTTNVLSEFGEGSGYGRNIYDDSENSETSKDEMENYTYPDQIIMKETINTNLSATLEKDTRKVDNSLRNIVFVLLGLLGATLLVVLIVIHIYTCHSKRGSYDLQQTQGNIEMGTK